MLNRMLDLYRFAVMALPLGGAFSGGRNRRGQTRAESAVALGVLIVAGVGAWMLYRDSIIATAEAMIGFFGSASSD